MDGFGKDGCGWSLTPFWFKDKRSVLPQLMASLAEIPLALEYFDVPRNAEMAEGRSPLIYVGSH